MKFGSNWTSGLVKKFRMDNIPRIVIDLNRSSEPNKKLFIFNRDAKKSLVLANRPDNWFLQIDKKSGFR